MEEMKEMLKKELRSSVITSIILFCVVAFSEIFFTLGTFHEFVEIASEGSQKLSVFIIAYATVVIVSIWLSLSILICAVKDQKYYSNNEFEIVIGTVIEKIVKFRFRTGKYLRVVVKSTENEKEFKFNVNYSRDLDAKLNETYMFMYTKYSKKVVYRHIDQIRTQIDLD